MSWLLVLALLVIFVVRTGFSMVSRQRLRAQTGMSSPAQTVAGPAQHAGARPSLAPVPGPRLHPADSAARDASAQPLATSARQARPPAEPVPGPARDDVAPGAETPNVVALPTELEGKVRKLMDTGFEAGAVRLICDELGIGILDAQKTARAVAGLPAA